MRIFEVMSDKDNAVRNKFWSNKFFQKDKVNNNKLYLQLQAVKKFLLDKDLILWPA